MVGITQDEVRRHPRWREEVEAPHPHARPSRLAGSRILGVVALIIVATAIFVVLLND